MNLAGTRVVIRARGIPEVFDLSLHFVVALGSRLLVKLWFGLALPGLLLCLWLRSRQVGWAVVWLCAIAWFALAQGFFTRACSKLLFAETLGLRDVLAKPFHTLSRQLWVCASTVFALGVSLLLLPLLPFALVRLLYLPEIMLLEGFGVLAGFERASRFTAGRFVTALEVLAVLFGMLVWFVGFGDLLGSAVLVDLLSFPAPEDDLMNDGGSPLALFGFFVSLPFITATRFLCYIDGRTRREAWDVQVRFSQIAERARGQAA